QVLVLPGESIVVGAIFDVKDLVTGAAGSRGEDTAACAKGVEACSGALVTPIRFQHEGGAGPPSRTGDAKAGIVHTEAHVPVRTHGHLRKALTIKVNRERQWDHCANIVSVVTGIVHARNEASLAHGEVVCANRAVGTDNVSRPGSSAKVIGMHCFRLAL